MNAAALRQLEQELQRIGSQLAEMQRTVDQIQASGQRNEAALQNLAVLQGQFRQMNAAVQRFAAFPVVPLRRPNQQQGEQAAAVAGPNNQQNDEDDNRNVGNANEIPFESSLSPKPRNLYELWMEYEHGIGGRRAARLFSRQERGRVKTIYTRRKVIWDEIARLVRAGDTHTTAIDRIYQAYGPTLLITTITKKIRDDRRTGGHPALRV